MVLTGEGLAYIVDLVKGGRIIYQRIVTWILNKVVKTFGVAVFIAVAFLLTGYYIVCSLDIIPLLFLIDFVTISLSTDTVSWSKELYSWNVLALLKVGVFLGVKSYLMKRFGVSAQQSHSPDHCSTLVILLWVFLQGDYDHTFLTLITIARKKSTRIAKSRPVKIVFSTDVPHLNMNMSR